MVLNYTLTPLLTKGVSRFYRDNLLIFNLLNVYKSAIFSTLQNDINRRISTNMSQL
ncbi:hypothetical protein ALT721_600042 [Alteromonas alvinellae]